MSGLRLYLWTGFVCAVSVLGAEMIAGDASERFTVSLCLVFLVGVLYALFMTREGRR